MTYLEIIESKLEKLTSNTLVSLVCIAIVGFLLRVYFVPWNLPSASSDTTAYLAEALNYARGDFSNFNFRFGWPMFLSIFFSFFKFDNYFEYLTVMRVISISVSVVTIPVLYLTAKQFVEKKYAILAATFFTVESNLVENSIFAITEPLFILLGLLSFYFIIQKNEKYVPLAFVFAGVATDTRLNGIVLFALLLLACSMKIRPKVKLIKTLLVGIGIFILVSFPISLTSVGLGSALLGPSEMAVSGGTVPPHLYDISNTVFGPQEEVISTIFGSSATPLENPTPFDIFKNALIKEFLHLFRISVPYLAIFAPFGAVASLKTLDYQKKNLFLVIIISLIVAFPIYLTSAVYRNLFFIIPFFCILSAIGIQKLTTSIEIKNLFLVLLVGGLILLSYSFLRERSDADIDLIREREMFGKFVASNLQGIIIGDNDNYIAHNIIDISQTPIIPNSNDKITMLLPDRGIITFSSFDSLSKFAKENNVTYIIVDNEYDNRYPIFQDIFYDEKNYPTLKKVFDSDDAGYKKYRVKIFEVIYD